jgi:hypothetical protein
MEDVKKDKHKQPNWNDEPRHNYVDFDRCDQQGFGARPRSQLKNLNETSILVACNGEAASPSVRRVSRARKPMAVPTQD